MNLRKYIQWKLRGKFINMCMHLFIDMIHIYKIVITMRTIFTCSGILERENSQQSMLHK